MKGAGRARIPLRRAFIAKIRGLTLIEVMMTLLVFGVISGSLLLAFGITNTSIAVGATKAALQAQARTAINWIIKDVRQTSSSQINNNTPAGDYIKFKVVTGHDGMNATWSLDAIEYSYDEDIDTLTRTDHNTGKTFQFADIAEPPFDVSTLAENYLTITITMRKQAIGTISPEVSLSSEVKFRNG